MCSDIVSVKVAGVCVGIVANLAAIRVLWWSFISAETSNADWSWVFRRPQAIGIVGIKVGQFRFNLFLHLEVHQVRTWTGWAWLGVNTASGTGHGHGAGKFLLRRFWVRVNEVGDRKSFRVPKHLVMSRIIGRGQGKVFLLFLDRLVNINNFILEAVSRITRVSAFSIRFLHWQIQHRRRLWKVVIVWRWMNAWNSAWSVSRWWCCRCCWSSRLTFKRISSTIPQTVTDVKPLLWN